VLDRVAALFTPGKMCDASGRRSKELRAADGEGVKVDPALADVEVKDTEGNPVRLGSLWADRPAVVIWVRHFG